jgi:hypothetical protein
MGALKFLPLESLILRLDATTRLGMRRAIAKADASNSEGFFLCSVFLADIATSFLASFKLG